MTNQEENETSEQPSPVEDADQWFKFADNDFTTATLAVEEDAPPISTMKMLKQRWQWLNRSLSL